MAIFVSLNVNGLRDSNKRLSLLQWLSHIGADFVCLQQVHVVSCAEGQHWFSPFGFLVISSPGLSHLCGSVLLYRPKYEVVRLVCDKDGRFRIVTVYAPNRNPQRDTFFEYVRDQVDALFPTIICGDFNTVWDRAVDRCGSGSAFPILRSCCF